VFLDDASGVVIDIFQGRQKLASFVTIPALEDV
jgi:hypothetical protein